MPKKIDHFLSGLRASFAKQFFSLYILLIIYNFEVVELSSLDN